MSWVTIFDWQPAVPVYHDSSWERYEEFDGGALHRTHCGRVRMEWDENGHTYLQKDIIPVRHAVKFARPCRQCYIVEDT